MHDTYLTVTALTKYLKKKLDIDPHLQRLFIKGEISNFKHHNRGHMYMTIKDEGAQIRAVMFASNNENLKFKPENGMKVLIEGNVSVFEAYGQYQLYIHSLEPDGKGALYLAYEQLKEKLAKEGFFDSKYKREIPAFPANIAVITSPSGAAVRDIISTVKRRFPIVQLTIFPVLVQGEAAIPSILEGLKTANELKHMDTIIIGRGGGSIEDLWAFNDEQVAKAIFHSKIPVISGIGHETDFTISDFTADLRAATPTGAAEQAVPSLLELKSKVEQLRPSLFRAAKYNILTHKKALQRIQSAPALQKPNRLFRDKEQEIDKLTETMHYQLKRIRQQHEHNYQQLTLQLGHLNPTKRIHETRKLLQERTQYLEKAGREVVQNKAKELQMQIQRLTLLNPLTIMRRGYSITYGDDQSILASVERVVPGDNIKVKLIDGALQCTINEVWRDETDGGK